MESVTISAEENEAFTNNKDSQDKKIETDEIASDRESSVDSFHTNKSEFSNTTGTELIDVDDIELSDEESWLYQSPKKVSVEEKSQNTYKWLHKDVEEMDDKELQVTKKALVSKLKQLQIHNEMPKKASAQSLYPSSEKVIASTQSLDAAGSDCLRGVNKTNTVKEEIRENSQESSAVMQPKISEVNELFDVTDVQKIARLQEESLKQSMPRYHMYTERRNSSASRSLSPAVYTQTIGLSKPSSVEALNTCCGKSDQSNIYSLPRPQRMKKINSFGSSSALHCQNLDLS
ncbi:SLAIN motif-containing protein-like [Uloborus diversus]|uniref:SLAIN motif-containing protein-like n=1 Tax=Uloborus diversus TaxID=327109 RepID=UPI002409FBBA|nr:SLAIN motif-containing protein-like [Uloborus diversus]